jgi:hypothetical protein
MGPDIDDDYEDYMAERMAEYRALAARYRVPIVITGFEGVKGTQSIVVSLSKRHIALIALTHEGCSACGYISTELTEVEAIELRDTLDDLISQAQTGGAS